MGAGRDSREGAGQVALARHREARPAQPGEDADERPEAGDARDDRHDGLPAGGEQVGPGGDGRRQARDAETVDEQERNDEVQREHEAEREQDRAGQGAPRVHDLLAEGRHARVPGEGEEE